MGRFKFIHAADVHLGSLLSVEGLDARPELKDLCYQATYTAFENICRLAEESEASFVLLSGDVYDQEARSVRANRFFVDYCKKLNEAGIQVYVLAGNHDPVREYQEMFILPENTHLISADKPEIHYVKDKEGADIAAIIGQSYGSRQVTAPLHLSYPKPERGIFSIAMLHTQLESGRSSYIPANLGELSENPNFDYWALGHIHKPQVLRLEKPAVLYPGTPQGRDFGEQNTGGCWLIGIDQGEIESFTYWAVSPVEYQSLAIDIGCPELKEADSLDELEKYILSQAAKLSDKVRRRPDLENWGAGSRINFNLDAAQIEGFILRLEISGRGRLHSYLQKDRQDIEQNLCEHLRFELGSRKPFVWIDSVRIRTASPVTAEILDRHPVLKQLLEDVIQTLETDESKRKEFISQLGYAWTTSFHYEEPDDEHLPLDQDTLTHIIEEAKQELLEGVAEEGGEA
jgi:exonuclease SbcD